jgi:hemolysin activation/secretion protein
VLPFSAAGLAADASALRGGVTRLARVCAGVALLVGGLGVSRAQEQGTAGATDAPAAAPTSAEQEAQSATGSLFIREFRVKGSTKLPMPEVEDAVYPYLGPGRTEGDVEQARAALEKVYQDKGFQTVSVVIPQQEVRGGVVYLQVEEAKVGRLRVKGSRYFSLDAIKKGAPSLAEGKVPNFNEVARDMVALNQLPDRRITPTMRPGVEPGTYDVDLNVKDTFPLHGSLELNNRYSQNTTPLRLNGAVSYSNLWQLGHTLGFSFQIAPQNIDDAQVYSAYYLARIPQVEWFSLMFQATRQNSNVSTLGGGATAGNGSIVGGRAMFTLPAPNTVGFYHSLSLGLDYKHFDQDITVGGVTTGSPITYWPWSLNYNAALAGKSSTTELNAAVVFGFQGMGSTEVEFDNRRYNADGSFIYFRGDLSHTQDLPFGFQAYGQTQGQIANQPLVDSEQFSLGGLDTVRGYLESEVLGDNALCGTFELRTPSVPQVLGIDEWRFYGFVDGGAATLNDPLPEQTSRFNLASIGAGSRIHLLEFLNGSVDAGVPLISQPDSSRGQVRVTFRLWGEF